MCGRFAQGLFAEWSEASLELIVPSGAQPRYNLAPSELALVRRPDNPTLAPMRWGLVPAWADDPNFGLKTFNARVETVDRKPAFRDAFKKRRCIVPVDGFYEWQGAKGSKVPHFIRSSAGPMLLAGLWEEASGQRTFAVVTMEPNPLVATLHDRMPMVLDPGTIDLWFRDGALNPADLAEIQARAKDLSMQEYAVGKLRGDGPQCVEPAAQMALF